MKQNMPVITFVYVREGFFQYDDGNGKKAHPQKRLIARDIAVTPQYFAENGGALLTKESPLGVIITDHGKTLEHSSHARVHGRGEVIQSRYYEIVGNNVADQPYFTEQPTVTAAVTANPYY